MLFNSCELPVNKETNKYPTKHFPQSKVLNHVPIGICGPSENALARRHKYDLPRALLYE